VAWLGHGFNKSDLSRRSAAFQRQSEWFMAANMDGRRSAFN